MNVEGRNTDIVQESHLASTYSFALKLDTNDRSKALDVGSGNGSSLIKAVDWSNNYFQLFIEVDINRSILLAIPQNQNLYPVVADGLCLPFVDNQFPLVISSQVIEHIPFDKHLDFAKELARVTQLGGNIVIATANRDFPHNVKGHRSHIAEFDIDKAMQFTGVLKQFGNSELLVVVPSTRFIRAQAKRAKMWFLRPIKHFIPRGISETVMTLLSQGEIHKGIDMRSDFQIKRLVDLQEDEICSDYIFKISKTPH